MIKDDKKSKVMDRPTDGATDQPTDTAGHRVPCTQLKSREKQKHNMASFVRLMQLPRSTLQKHLFLRRES